MAISACLTAKIGDFAQLVGFEDKDLTMITESYPGLSEQDLCIVGALGSLFDLTTNPLWANIAPKEGEFPMMYVGELVDNTTNPSHPQGSISFQTFTADSAKRCFSRFPPYNYAGTAEEWKTLVEQTAFEDLIEIPGVNEQYANILKPYKGKFSIKITPTSTRDLDNLNESSVNPYIDLYSAIKDAIINNPTKLGEPFEIASDGDGEYIKLTSYARVDLGFIDPTNTQTDGEELEPIPDEETPM